MPLPKFSRFLLRWCAALVLLPGGGDGFSWGFDRHTPGEALSAQLKPAPNPVSVRSRRLDLNIGPQEQHISNAFSMALQELRKMEYEPLCHRIAARLLINNCQLVDGHDEETVHLDSGRAVRDFVDSYAASLAICDLERGSFEIPPSCEKFREITLAAMPVSKRPQLHVSTSEIDACLKALAYSDSAWNTWVSYRHTAHRFCHIARAESDKNHIVHVSQRVTMILERMSSQIEIDLQEKLESLNRIMQETTDSVNGVAARVDQLGADFSIVMSELEGIVKESSASATEGLAAAQNLQQMLSLLVRTAMDNTAEVAVSQQDAIQVLSQTVNQELGTLTSVLFSALASSASLQHQMVVAQARTEEILENQSKIEAGMERLEGTADSLSVKFGSHQSRLEKAQEKADEILNTLDTATVSAQNFGSSFLGGFQLSDVLPYIICPVMSLMMGSYGLQPSLGRNLWLVGIGELAGFVFSTAGRYANVLLTASAQGLPSVANMSASFNMSS